MAKKKENKDEWFFYKDFSYKGFLIKSKKNKKIVRIEYNIYKNNKNVKSYEFHQSNKQKADVLLKRFINQDLKYGRL